MAAFCNFYRCETCNNIVNTINKGGGRMFCCGQPMTLLIAGSIDADASKHVPIIERNEQHVTVRVGGIEHHSDPEHFIQWIQITDGSSIQRKTLNSEDRPIAKFILEGNSPITAYEYCNVHGLWKAEE